MSIALLIDLGERLKTITTTGHPEDAAALADWVLKDGLSSLKASLVAELTTHATKLVKESTVQEEAVESTSKWKPRLSAYVLPQFSHADADSHTVFVYFKDEALLYINYGKNATVADIHDVIARHLKIPVKTVWEVDTNTRDLKARFQKTTYNIAPEMQVRINRYDQGQCNTSVHKTVYYDDTFASFLERIGEENLLNGITKLSVGGVVLSESKERMLPYLATLTLPPRADGDDPIPVIVVE
ncbi:Hypothetical protein POVN_LOCUS329 [uncultured virus]|nr:Hypothetical protein POVN_LOCUS329 [uncultured virus]